ncbi:MAG: non-canonical purine NTP diphosphatase [Muribaculaceae bacterium]|nr:non-canonical purine NTP diphosphatase [Muribaculaceae bacterium]
MKKIVFATNNAHKLRELREIAGEKFEILSLKDINCFDDIPETASTLEGNALIKANYIKEHYGYDCFADDTGLEIDSLGGEPGVYSARYAGEDCNSENNIDKVLKNLEGNNNRAARFVTVIALRLGDEIFTFEGEVKGEILTERSGVGGFGYDPIFKPLEADCSFAKMLPEQKNAISHRGRAVKKLFEFLKNI